MCESVQVGTNRRYPDAGARRGQERRLQEIRLQGRLQSLTEEQLDLDNQAVSIAPERATMWGLAWLRFGDADIRCPVRVRRWTDDAVGVEVDVGTETLRCWVWQGAVQRTAGRPPAG
ncbi:hypothetical protein [Klenkia taihuensis]|uniref:hypothetical protein n=1 Tax=Klenkia taihuensis TaxID=1225127 RepID=UPI001041BD45|nr:hypothetical protein [Klenkia taihuensis]GHE06883.1 hypothetical protein GCM10011381_00540 [Klenkia taihuensis]